MERDNDMSMTGIEYTYSLESLTETDTEEEEENRINSLGF